MDNDWCSIGKASCHNAVGVSMPDFLQFFFLAILTGILERIRLPNLRPFAPADQFGYTGGKNGQSAGPVRLAAKHSPTPSC
jgi:hypothetical protein